MSDKKLLAEATIRRFMKLASVDAMTNNFIAENFKEDKLEEEEIELEENIEALDEQEEDMEIEAELGEEDPMMDSEEPPMDLDSAPETGAADMSLTEDEAQLLIDLGKRLEEAMAGETDDPSDEESDEDMEAVEDMDAMGDIGPEDEVDSPAKAYMEEAQEGLVNEVLRRVTKRLVAKKLKNRK